MIEKLDLDKRNSFGTLDWLEHWNEPSGAKLIESKINELVDAVNGMLDYAPLEMAMKAEPEPADPYAEQRKWIGKICKFWNWDTGLAHYSKLITIKDINDGEMSNCPFRADDGGWYMYCEPVKPDDDIIYKGGNK